MKILKLFLIGFLLTFVFLTSRTIVSAQGAESGQTAQEEAEGKVIWDKLQAKQLECKNLTDINFDVLGEYFMGQAVGNTSRHTFMNQMMKNMLGDEREKQMHIAMGKRFSGCDTSASFIAPMLWMMGWGFDILGWFSMLIFWILLILGVVALIRYFGRSEKGNNKEKSSLDILKERYAKGEIDKKEFEEKKRDLI